MTKFKVYKLTSPSGKCYIGQTKITIEERFKQHVLAWKQHEANTNSGRYGSKLYAAFSKYPPEQWKLELLYEVESLEEVDLLEIECIKYYNTINEGYNILNGGQGFQRDYLTGEHKNNLSVARTEYFKTDAGLEWKKTLSKNFSGDNNPSHLRRDELKEQNSKWYLLIDVNDNEFIIKNLYEFKKTNKGKVVKMLPSDGKSYYCKYSDYRCMLLLGYSEELSDDEKLNIINESKLYLKPFKTWKLLSPDGIEYITCQLKVFAEEYNLTPQILSSVAKGKHPTHKGWGCTQII